MRVGAASNGGGVGRGVGGARGRAQGGGGGGSRSGALGVRAEARNAAILWRRAGMRGEVA